MEIRSTSDFVLFITKTSDLNKDKVRCVNDQDIVMVYQGDKKKICLFIIIILIYIDLYFQTAKAILGFKI